MFDGVEQSPSFLIGLEMLVDAEHIGPHELLSAIEFPLTCFNV